jgi:hypothetical protein
MYSGRKKSKEKRILREEDRKRGMYFSGRSKGKRKEGFRAKKEGREI